MVMDAILKIFSTLYQFEESQSHVMTCTDFHVRKRFHLFLKFGKVAKSAVEAALFVNLSDHGPMVIRRIDRALRLLIEPVVHEDNG